MVLDDARPFLEGVVAVDARETQLMTPTFSEVCDGVGSAPTAAKECGAFGDFLSEELGDGALELVVRVVEEGCCAVFVWALFSQGLFVVGVAEFAKEVGPNGLRVEGGVIASTVVGVFGVVDDGERLAVFGRARQPK